jgi:VanZ family protein
MINKLAAVLAWILLAALAFVTLSPISFRPQTGHVFLERFLAYVALGAAFGIGYPRRMPFAVCITVLAAIGLEAAQLLVPGRHARAIDAGEKLAGGIAGLAIAAAFLALTSRSGPRRTA